MSDTFITPAALADLRSEVDELRKNQRGLDGRTQKLEARLEALDNMGETVNELDDRADRHELRLDTQERSLRELADEIRAARREQRAFFDRETHRQVLGEATFRLISAVIDHLKIPVDKSVGPWPAFRDGAST